MTSPKRRCTSAIVARRSAALLRPLAKPNLPTRARSPASRANPRRDSTSAKSARVRAASRPSASKMKRSKFDAFEMSIDGLDVSRVSAALLTR